jgi:ATP-dependent RNA helicase DeaD
MEVAMAAVKLAQQAAAGEAEAVDIPAAAQPRETPGGERRPGERKTGERPGGSGRDGANVRGGTGRGAVARRRGLEGGAARLFIGAGREAGVRPQDLVGAITGEAGITGRQIGAIEIADRFSIVEVAEEVAAEVIKALRATTIKRRKVTVRRDRATEG